MKRVLIDIGHPAHVHYFRNYYFRMKERGNKLLVISRDKEMCFALLNAYGIPFLSRGSGKNSKAGKLLYMLWADWFIFKKARRFKPDIVISFASPYAAQAAFLLGKPHIALDDTEHAKASRSLYIPFTSKIITPQCYLIDIGAKQIRLPFYAEFAYLHRHVFIPDKDLARQLLGLKADEEYVLLRFISWNAAHDRGHSGIPDEMKLELIDVLTKKGFRVFISSESPLTETFSKYELKVKPEYIHHIIAAAHCFIGESGTMSNEACILGTPAFLINSLDAGVFRDEVKRGLLLHFKSPETITRQIINTLEQKDFIQTHHLSVEKLHADMMDVTDFLINYSENIG
ncbi:MAG: DUF354 domain-containing protein [Bacteroidia bacterium]